MKKNKDRLIDRPIIQLILVIALAFGMMGLSLILFEDLDLNKEFIIYATLGALTLMGFVFNYNLAYSKVYNYLYFGKTRKDFFFKFFFNLIIVFGILTFLIGFYMIGYKYIYNPANSVLRMFSTQRIIFLLLVYLIFSLIGFMFGLLKTNKWLFYILVIIIAAGVFYVLLFTQFRHLYNLILGAVVIILTVIDYLLIKYIEL